MRGCCQHSISGWRGWGGLILGEFLSGPRVWGRGEALPGTGVEFLGSKNSIMRRASVCERAVVSRVDGCPFPACDEEVKKHRKASIMRSENSPCGWLHGLHSHSLASKLSFSFLCSYSPPSSSPNYSPLSCSAALKKKKKKRLHNVAKSLERILQHPLRTLHMWTTFTGCLSTSPLITDIS